MNRPPFPSCWSIHGISSACPVPYRLKIMSIHVIIYIIDYNQLCDMVTNIIKCFLDKTSTNICMIKILYS